MSYSILGTFLTSGIWAGWKRSWGFFWFAFAVDCICLAYIASTYIEGQSWQHATLTLLFSRLFLAVIVSDQARALLRKVGCHIQFAKKGSFVSLAAGVLVSSVGYYLTITRFLLEDKDSVLQKFPNSSELLFVISNSIDNGIEWLTINFEGFFDSFTFGMNAILRTIEWVLVNSPWPIIAVFLLWAAWKSGGSRFTLFVLFAITYIGVFGFWEKTMSTLSLVIVSTFLCVLLGLPLGICSVKNRYVSLIMKPILDMMQTMPSFVYLIPAIAFFSIGKTPAVIATVIFALPPCIRLTALGIEQVPEEVKEAVLAYGATPLQLLLKAELPLATPSIMAGVNQSIMMSLSMVVISALIGAGGLGYDVLFSLQQVEAGTGLLSGMSIVFCAVILDRLVQGVRKH